MASSKKLAFLERLQKCTYTATLDRVSLRRLAYRTKTPYTSMIRYLKQLEADGHLCISRGGGRTKINVYQIQPPWREDPK